jgi:putative sigma-54 modulation protein
MNRKAKALEFVDAGWDIKITGRHIEVTDAMKNYAMEKVSKIERFINRILDVNVIMDIQKLEHRVDIALKAGNLKITSQAISNDMYISVDQAVDKLEAQLRRYKSKIQDHHAKQHAIIEMKVNVIRPSENDELDFDESLPTDETVPFKPHTIIREKTLPLKTLTYDEAIMKMELSNDHFLLFKNEANQRLNVIYRRNDGNYGVIEPACA